MTLHAVTITRTLSELNQCSLPVDKTLVLSPFSSSSSTRSFPPRLTHVSRLLYVPAPIFRSSLVLHVLTILCLHGVRA